MKWRILLYCNNWGTKLFFKNFIQSIVSKEHHVKLIKCWHCCIQMCFAYHLNSLGCQKKKMHLKIFFFTFMQKLNEIVNEYFRNKNLFKRHKYALQRHQMSNIFGGLTYTMRGLCVSLNHQHTTLWMQHWLEIISVPFFENSIIK